MHLDNISKIKAYFQNKLRVVSTICPKWINQCLWLLNWEIKYNPGLIMQGFPGWAFKSLSAGLEPELSQVTTLPPDDQDIKSLPTIMQDSKESHLKM